MGVYLHYQAMPEGSRLFRRLRVEQALCIMYAELIHRPAGPYDTARLLPEERDRFLADIAHNPVFGSRPAVDRAYQDLQAELDLAAADFPGLPDRAAYLKLEDFDRDLARALTRAGRPDAGPLADALVMGAVPLAPEGFGTGDVELRLVPPPLVAEAAELLRDIGPEQFEGSEGDFTGFRRVYAAAAERGEAVVVA
jgi:hypothetical protein